MKDINHKKVAMAVARELEDCGFPAFACTTSTAYHYSWGENPDNVTIRVHVVVGPDDDVRNLETLREELEMDDFADFNSTEEVFTGVCGHPDSVESLAHQMKREPWLRSFLQIEEEAEDED